MKILIVAQWIKIDGKEGGSTHQSEFAKALALEGNEVHLLCTTEDKFLGEGKERVILHPSPKGIRPLQSYKSMKLIEEICIKYKIDVIHKRMDVGSGFVLKVAKKLNIPVLAEVNYVPLSFEKRNSFYSDVVKPAIQTPLRKIWMKLTLEKADVILPVCETLKQNLKEFGLKNRIVVIYNGADTTNFNQEVKSNIKEEFGIEGDLITLVGNLGQRQGLELVLKVAEFFPNKTFMLIGGEPKYEEYIKEIKSKAPKNMLFIGRKSRKEIPKYLSASDICIAPYIQNKGESHVFFPIKILEYLAMGKPIITSDVKGMSELIQHEENGLLFEPQNSNDFINKINQLEDNELRNKLGENARKTAEKYSWKNSAKKSIFVYKLLIMEKIKL